MMRGVRLLSLRKENIELVASWLTQPDIVARWGDPATTLDEIRSLMAEAWGFPFLIAADGRPVGYLQTYNCDADPDPYWTAHAPPGSFGFDLFIAAAEDRGAGIGSAAIGQLIAWLSASTSCRQVIVDPHVDNIGAVRLYRRLGFRIVATLRDHPEGHNHLMILPLARAG